MGIVFWNGRTGSTATFTDEEWERLSTWQRQRWGYTVDEVAVLERYPALDIRDVRRLLFVRWMIETGKAFVDE